VASFNAMPPAGRDLLLRQGAGMVAWASDRRPA
jgi:hypothetical protein